MQLVYEQAAKHYIYNSWARSLIAFISSTRLATIYTVELWNTMIFNYTLRSIIIAQNKDRGIHPKMTIEEMLHEKIKRQVEFYFGDANYPRDKFLLESAGKDAGGWIS